MISMCNLPDCGWKSTTGLLESTVKKLATTHIITKHPDVYEEVTGKTPPEISEMDKFELEAWTDR